MGTTPDVAHPAISATTEVAASAAIMVLIFMMRCCDELFAVSDQQRIRIF